LKSKRMIVMTLLIVSIFSSGGTVHAEMVNNQINEKVVSTNGTAPDSPVNTPTTAAQPTPAPITTSSSTNNTNANGFMGVMNGVSSNLNTTAQNETSTKTSAGAAKITNKVAQFVMAILPTAIIIWSAIETLLLFVPPLQGLVNTGGGSGGGLEGGSSGSKGKIPWVTKDFKLALAGGGSGGSSGGLDGGGSGGGKGGVADSVKLYVKLRMKTTIWCLVAMFLIVTPATFNLCLALMQHFIKWFNVIIYWIAGAV